ncbi:unnamed protein product [Choristocarpus tenellus]
MQGMGPKRPSTGSFSSRVAANAMLEAKNQRKRAEADVNLLANRLAHLRVEEEKARKKTEETMLRAAEILNLKKRNDEVAHAREVKIKAEVKLANESERKLAERKTKQRHDLESTMLNLEKARKSNAKTAREQKQALQMTYQEIRAKNAEENKRRTERMRKQREDARRKREEEQRERERKQREDHARRIALENRKTQEAERLIHKMEEDEDALIERLKKTQEDQRKAYEKLHHSLET